MTISLDANVIIRLFINKDAQQTAAATACLETYDQVQIGDIALVETIYALANYYELGRVNTVRLVQTLLTHPKINCNRPLFDAALRHYQDHPALSIEDCCLAVQAKLNNAAPLLTFDKKLANQLEHAELLKV